MGVIALGASGSTPTSSLASSGSGTAHPPENDVTISACAITDNEFEGPSATLTVLNNSSKPSDYFVTVAFESTDGKQQLDTAIAAITALASGQTATEQAVSLKSDLRAQPFTCKVTKVFRTASA